MRIISWAACLLLAVTLITPARAGLLLDAGPNAGVGTWNAGNYVAGSEFTAQDSFTVRSLGWLDVLGDGLTDSHRVGLWDTSTQQLIVDAVVTPTSFAVESAMSSAQWFMTNVAPVTLNAGTYRVAGLVGTGGDREVALDSSVGNGVTISDGYVRNEFPNGGFAYPDLVFSADAIRATVSTEFYGTTAVPEPASMSLLGFGLLGVWGLRRRMKKSA